MTDTVKVTQHWCLTADRTRVVPETSVEARSLLWPTGTEITVEQALRHGLTSDGQKMRPPVSNKARRAGGNK